MGVIIRLSQEDFEFCKRHAREGEWCDTTSHVYDWDVEVWGEKGKRESVLPRCVIFGYTDGGDERDFIEKLREAPLTGKEALRRERIIGVVQRATASEE